jgi:hypothetical protein
MYLGDKSHEQFFYRELKLFTSIKIIPGMCIITTNHKIDYRWCNNSRENVVTA